MVRREKLGLAAGALLIALAACSPATPAPAAAAIAKPVPEAPPPELQPSLPATPERPHAPAPKTASPAVRPNPKATSPEARPVPLPGAPHEIEAPAAIEAAPPLPPSSPATGSAAAATPAAPAAPAEVPAGPPPAAPTLDLVAPSFPSAGPATVHVTAGPQAAVRFTVDGSDPASGKVLAGPSLTVDHSCRLRVWAAVAGGPPTVQELAITVGEVWVTPGGGGSGAWNAPLGSLEAALQAAGALKVGRIRLTGGNYSVQSTLTGHWELWGGWKAPGVEDSTATVFAGVRQSGSSQKNPASVLKIADGATVVLRGLDVRAPSSSYAAAVVVGRDASVTVTDSRLVGGAGLYGYGLQAVGAKLVSLADSTLSGGDGGSSFALSANQSTVMAVRTRFDAGTGDAVSYALNLTQSQAVVVSCVLWGGSGNSSYGVGLYASGQSRFWASTVLGGKGLSAWGFYLSDSDPEIVDCLIGSSGQAKSYGIFANYGKSLPRSLRSNAFFDSATGALAGVELGPIPSALDASGAFRDAKGHVLAGQSRNILAQPVLGPAPDFKTLPGSPQAILEGAEPLGGDADLDVAKVPRGTPGAIGAW